MKVTAIRRGFIYGIFRREGDIFELENAEHFSDYWMEKGEAEIKEPEITHAKLKYDNEPTFNSCDVEYPELEIPENVVKKRKRRTKAEIEAANGVK